MTSIFVSTTPYLYYWLLENRVRFQTRRQYVLQVRQS